MHVLEPARGRAFECAFGQAEQNLGLRRDEDFVGRDVPVEDEVARAGEGERATLGVGDEPLRQRAAREGVLHHGEADQEHDQHEAADQSGRHEVASDLSDHGEAGRGHPHQQQEPGRDQHHRPLIAMGGKVQDQHEANRRHRRDRDAGDTGRHWRVEHRESDQPGEAEDPDDGDVAVTHMPARQVEIGEEEDD